MLVWRHLGTSLTLQALVWAAGMAMGGHGGWPRAWDVSGAIGSGCSSHPGLPRGLYWQAAVVNTWRKHVERDKYSFSSS